MLYPNSEDKQQQGMPGIGKIWPAARNGPESIKLGPASTLPLPKSPKVLPEWAEFGPNSQKS